MLKKSLFIILGALVLPLIYLIFSIPEDFFRSFIASAFSAASETELDYIDGFLNDAFFTKIRWSMAVSLLFVIAIIAIWKRYARDVKGEVKTIFSWTKTTINDFGSLTFWGLLTITAIVGIILIPQIQINSDEAYAFEYFTQRNPIISLVTYPAPNNHVFYSFLSSVLYRIVPFDLYALRIPSLFAGILTMGILLLFNFRKWGKSVSFIALISTLCTFYPLFYSVQGRGYGIFLLLATMWSILILKSIEKRRLEKPIIMCLTAVLGLYTIPVFLYPFVIGIGLLVFFVSFKSILKLGLVTTVMTVILYAPIILFFGHEVLLNNEFVESLSLSAIMERFPRYFFGFLHHYISATVILFYLILRGFKGLKSPVIQMFLCFFMFSALIPLIHGKFPPMRVFIYLIPVTTLALASILKLHKKLSFLLIPLLIYTLYFTKNQYQRFNQYSTEARNILQSAVEQGADKIYLLDGPRSIFNWYVKQEYPTLQFNYSLNRDSLNMRLLEDKRYQYISEYRWRELPSFPFKVVDSTEYFRHFKHEDKQ